jgi:hypothetical protein
MSTPKMSVKKRDHRKTYRREKMEILERDMRMKKKAERVI